MASRKNLLIRLAAALAIAVAVAGLAAAFLTGDGEVRTAASPSATPPSIEVAGAQQTATTVAPTATATVMPATATPLPPSPTVEPTAVEPTALPDRTSCDEISGTAYRSEQERQFFITSCLPTPVPATRSVIQLGPTAELDPPVATASAAQPLDVVTSSIEGWWFLMFDNGGAHEINLDGQGRVVGFKPPERAPQLSGSGSIVGNSMRIDASGFVTNAGTSFSFTFMGTRLPESEFDKLISLDPTIAALTKALGGQVFWGQLKRSDMATANTVAAIKWNTALR